MGSAPLRGSAAQIFTMFPELKTLNSQKINSQIPEIKFPTRAVDSNYSAPDEDQTKKTHKETENRAKWTSSENPTVQQFRKKETADPKTRAELSHSIKLDSCDIRMK